MDKKYLYMWMIVLILLLGNIYLNVMNTRLERENTKVLADYNDLYETVMVTEYNEKGCFLWVMKGEDGIATLTEYCAQLKVICSSDNHNLSCKWISSELVDIEGNLLNNTAEGCQCVGG